MSVSYLKINTAALQSDANELNSLLQQVRSNLDNMYTSVNTLDGMWDGKANNAFNAQFADDHTRFSEICTAIEKLISDMQEAANKYNNCENEIYSTISSINI